MAKFKLKKNNCVDEFSTIKEVILRTILKHGDRDKALTYKAIYPVDVGICFYDEYYIGAYKGTPIVFVVSKEEYIDYGMDSNDMVPINENVSTWAHLTEKEVTRLKTAGFTQFG